jgi:hypothetical protein
MQTSTVYNQQPTQDREDAQDAKYGRFEGEGCGSLAGGGLLVGRVETRILLRGGHTVLDSEYTRNACSVCGIFRQMDLDCINPQENSSNVLRTAGVTLEA